MQHSMSLLQRKHMLNYILPDTCRLWIQARLPQMSNREQREHARIHDTYDSNNDGVHGKEDIDGL